MSSDLPGPAPYRPWRRLRPLGAPVRCIDAAGNGRNDQRPGGLVVDIRHAALVQIGADEFCIERPGHDAGRADAAGYGERLHLALSLELRVDARGDQAEVDRLARGCTILRQGQPFDQALGADEAGLVPALQA